LSPKTLETKPEVVEALRQTMLRQRPTGIAAAARGMAKRADSTPLLPKIAVPTLVLGGADDVLSPPSSLDAIAAAIPGAQRATIPDAGHVASLENPDAFADAVLRWAESAL
jgi:pimeloyl-ACP methyl ester carboxylesterase